jgi:tryptophan synthase alpha chain
VSRIRSRFDALRSRGRKAFVAFVTAGDPSLERSVEIALELERAGVDVLELGVPFSDPLADGPVIQRASERALAGGTSLRDVLAFVAEFRRTNKDTPVVLMGYANPIEAMGLEAFAGAAAQSGVDGVLVVDYPPEECVRLAAELEPRGIDIIFLLAPTSTDERISGVARLARGYVYYVSLRGVTGAANLDLAEVTAMLPRIRKRIALPIGVGFGIRDAQTARAVAGVADAVVIGSRLVQEIENSPRERVLDNISALLKDIRQAIDAR